MYSSDAEPDTIRLPHAPQPVAESSVDARTTQLLSHNSSIVEKVLEYHFLAALTAELFARGVEFEVLRSDVDDGGHDLVIEAGGVLRHIQLKGMARGGARANVTVNMKLARKPSGCVVWLVYDPKNFVLGPFRWLGGLPGTPLPSLGDRVAKHSRANANGIKALREGHRIVPLGRFENLESIEKLTDLLFGAAPVSAQ